MLLKMYHMACRLCRYGVQKSREVILSNSIDEVFVFVILSNAVNVDVFGSVWLHAIMLNESSPTHVLLCVNMMPPFNYFMLEYFSLFKIQMLKFPSCWFKRSIPFP